MNLVETLQIIAALREVGAISFKSKDFEISIGHGAMVPVRPSVLPPSPEHVPPSQPSPEDTEKLKDLINTMKLDDNQLFDKIFPAGAGG